MKGDDPMKEFNENRFITYLSDLRKSYRKPSSDYEKGAHDLIKRISDEFITDHYEASNEK